jgi:hypothetical protein
MIDGPGGGQIFCWSFYYFRAIKGRPNLAFSEVLLEIAADCPFYIGGRPENRLLKSRKTFWRDRSIKILLQVQKETD